MKEIKGIFFRDFSNAYVPEILKEVYRDRIYFPFVEQSGRKDLTIVDCGGNIGLTTFYFSDFAQKIYTIEPAKQHFEVLSKMVEFNKISDKVIPINVAVSVNDGETTFFHNQNTTMFSLRSEVGTLPTEAEMVKTLRLDTLFTQYDIKHVDFMKLDVEGSECEIIGGEGFKNVADRIDSMVIEWHTWSGRNPKQVTTTLNDLGFDTWIIPSEATLIGAKKR